MATYIGTVMSPLQ